MRHSAVDLSLWSSTKAYKSTNRQGSSRLDHNVAERDRIAPEPSLAHQYGLKSLSVTCSLHRDIKFVIYDTCCCCICHCNSIIDGVNINISRKSF